MIGFLYGQTCYNMLKNSIHLKDYINYAKKNNYSFLSITDSNMHGYLKFFNECNKNDMTPIIGLELTLKSADSFDNQILLYAYDEIGLNNLLKISSKSKIKKDILEIKDLKDLTDNLFLVTAGQKTDLNRLYSDKNDKDFLEILSKYQEVFTNIYFGISNQINEDIDYNLSFYKYLKNNKYVSLPLHQTLFLLPEDNVVYDALCKIGNTFKNDTSQNFCFPTKKLLQESFLDFEDIFKNIENLINKIKKIELKNNTSLPKYPNKQNVESNQYLRALCMKGMLKRLNDQKKDIKVYEKRLNYELQIIDKMNYSDYFLIVWDFIKYAKSNNILVGPGRGSAAGSLVSYCLGITNVDPIKYGLLFERFLNPERISMPDIDIDFPDDKRDEVIQYVKKIYGENNVCSISTFGTFLVKSSIRDIARIFKIANDRVDIIIKTVEEANDFDHLLKTMKDNGNEEIYNLLKIAKKLEGLPRHTSTHAAGIILSASSLFDLVPMQEGINQMYQSQLEASDLESLGLIKIDFLGLKNLSIISNVMNEISLDLQKLNALPLNDIKTYKLFQEADTLGIFQLESEGIKQVLKKLKPTRFEDIVAVLALYRPGPMDSIDEFINRKHTGKYELIHQDLKEILKETYGIIVYQEQIMQILLKIANYSLAEADLLRRAISKKDEKVILDEKERFISSSVKNGYEQSIATKIYELIIKFANYGFNKSHAVAYALISYQMAYLKANHFETFMKRMLDNVIGSSSLPQYITYAKKRRNYAKDDRVTVVNPDINISTLEFVSKADTRLLYFPLQGIYSVGEIVARKIIEERKLNGLFSSYSDFIKRVPSINSRTLEYLIYSGAFDSFGESKRGLTQNIVSNTDIIDKYLDDIIKDDSEYEENFLIQKEKESIGMNLKYNLFSNIEELLKVNKATLIENIEYNQTADVLVIINYIRQIVDKNNNEMAFLTLSDANTNNYNAVIFGDIYSKIKSKLVKDQLILMNVKKNRPYKEKEESIVINSIKEVKRNI